MSAPASRSTTQESHGAVAYSPDAWDSPTHSYSDAGSPASPSDSVSSPPTTPPSSDSESELLSSPKPSFKARAHVPRPRNAFIVFRSHFYREAKAQSSDINQNTLSCEAALVWKSLSDEEKEPFVRQAEEEKLLHYKLYPDYIYTPLNKVAKPKRAQRAKPNPPKKQPSRKLKKSLPLSPRALHRVSEQRPLAPRSRRPSASRSSASSSSSRSTRPVDSEMPLSNFNQVEKNVKRVDGDSSEQSDQADVQFGIAPGLIHSPIREDETNAAYVCSSMYLDVPAPLTMTIDSSYPSWFYGEHIPGVPDTGVHAGWNPVQMTLDAYSDRYLYNGYNEVDAYSQFIRYDAMNRPTLVQGLVYPIFDQDGVWNGL
ncbi:hypothetical protein AX15_000393 [Amanita polypyramis BW_CC]|nr:hypothetical protein AX15_000393 [Amanita polypyramis BW_CC]